MILHITIIYSDIISRVSKIKKNDIPGDILCILMSTDIIDTEQIRTVLLRS